MNFIVEFVLKLKDLNDPNVWKKHKRKKPSRPLEDQAPPGYMASLVNKIANNISIKCNNIILKYVEEDIVVSMNIQLFSFDSADDNWNPAFIEISPTNVTQKKVINIQDLTICLDKRNSSGKIEFCQEPLLYRCTLQLRMLRKYNVSTVQQTSITRLDIHANLLNLNISNQQFPMVMRLLYLFLNLKQGNIRMKAEVGSSSENLLDTDENESGESYLSWAWNMLPTIFPTDDENNESNNMNGHLLHTGIYIDKLELLFKTQEIFGDPIVYASRKIKFVPFLRIAMDGIFFETISLGFKWFNMQGGVSSLGIYPVGDCSCGAKHNTQYIVKMDEVQNDLYYRNTLIDKESDENAGKNRVYYFSWDAHFLEVTEEVMSQRTPGIALDLLHQIEMPEETGRSSDFGSDFEYSNLSEKTLMRAVIGPLKINYGTVCNHIFETLTSYTKLYDYSPYVIQKPLPTLSQLSPPSTDDYDALMAEIPLVAYNVLLQKPEIQFTMWDHQKSGHSNRKFSMPHKSSYSSTKHDPVQHSILINFDKIELNYTIPMYPNRLVYTTCQLPEPPKKLYDSCFNKIELDIEKISINTICNEKVKQIASIPNLIGSINLLIRPDLWTNDQIKHINAGVIINECNILANYPHAIVFSNIVKSVIYGKITQKSNSNPNLILDMYNQNNIQIKLIIKKAKLKTVKTKDIQTYCFDVESILGYAYSTQIIKSNLKNLENFKTSLILSGPDVTIEDTNRDQLISAVIQIPIDSENPTSPPIILLTLTEISVNLNAALSKLLTYNIPRDHDVIFAESGSVNLTDNTPKRLSVGSMSKKLAKKIDSIHSSSDKDTQTIVMKLDERDKVAKREFDFGSYFNFLKLLIVQFELRHCTIIVPVDDFEMISCNSILEMVQHNLDKNFAIVKLVFFQITYAI